MPGNDLSGRLSNIVEFQQQALSFERNIVMTRKDMFHSLESLVVSSLAGLFEEVADWFARLAVRTEEEKKRAEISKLLRLEDWQLRDMGVSRDDVKSALMQPLEENSGARLTNARRWRSGRQEL